MAQAGVGSALNTVATWLQGRLSGDTALMALVKSVDEDVDPDAAAAYPFVVFRHMAGLKDTRVVGMTGLVANVLYEVRVIDRDTSYSAAAAAYARVHQLIDRTGYAPVSTDIGDGQIIACYRQNPVQYVEILGGIAFRSVGGLYQLAVN
jgi:hypothetical protein